MVILLTQSKQTLLINGYSSELGEVMKAGVPYNWVLGSLLFLKYINDICDNISRVIARIICTLVYKKMSRNR